MVRLTLIGIDHQEVAPSRLEVLSSESERIRARLVDLREQGAVRGAVLLSTCNRVEAVLDVAEGVSAEGVGAEGASDRLAEDRYLAELLLEGRTRDAEGELPLHVLADRAGVAHMLRVATGLESMVLGEEQILGQISRAFQVSEELGLMSRPLHMLRTRLLNAARELRQRTGFSKTRSVAALAADKLAAAGKRLCVVGAGETARLALDVLRRRGVENPLVVNRTLDKAQALARHFGGEAMGLAAFRKARENGEVQVDGVLLAIHSPTPVFGIEHAAGVKTVVDVSQPSVVAEELRTLEACAGGCEVLDLDGIAALAAEETAALREVAEVGRAQAEARAEQIWADLVDRRAHLGKVVDLHVENALSELDKALRGSLQHLADDDRDQLRKLFEKTARRNAHFHLRDLRQLQPS